MKTKYGNGESKIDSKGNIRTKGMRSAAAKELQGLKGGPMKDRRKKRSKEKKKAAIKEQQEE
jgi:hypothetical protein